MDWHCHFDPNAKESVRFLPVDVLRALGAPSILGHPVAEWLGKWPSFAPISPSSEAGITTGWRMMSPFMIPPSKPFDRIELIGAGPNKQRRSSIWLRSKP